MTRTTAPSSRPRRSSSSPPRIATGAADASPKGDPAGFVRVLDDRTLAIPYRPGNHRTDTFHNIVQHPAVAVVSLIPGDDRLLEIAGTVRPTTDPEILAPMAVNGRTPAIATVIVVARVHLRTSDPIAGADLWNSAHHAAAASLPKATTMWTEHVKQNTTNGLAAKALRAATK